MEQPAQGQGASSSALVVWLFSQRMDVKILKIFSSLKDSMAFIPYACPTLVLFSCSLRVTAGVGGLSSVVHCAPGVRAGLVTESPVLVLLVPSALCGAVAVLS